MRWAISIATTKLRGTVTGELRASCYIATAVVTCPHCVGKRASFIFHQVGRLGAKKRRTSLEACCWRGSLKWREI
jgi:hypothetical protein